ncbi:MAG: UDP-N-acetylmuramoyl-L-alanine--D-glutamate ligase [bacterium]|nr:UDP-N-acetylmuramoyl-L-alanine--D-glutamate ligase [bacterium]
MKIAILGYGIEGKSAEKFLRKQLRGSASKLEIRDVKKQGKDYLKNLQDFDMLVRSPGIPYLSSEIQKAKKAGVEITSTTKLFFKYAKGLLIGITGTKGKGTTATLLYEILKAGHLASRTPSGGNIHLIGNMGIPMLDELPKLSKNSISILELSSFQLQDMDVSPHIAVVLDISPDHLNYHKNFKEYLEAKARLVKNARQVFYFSDNKYSRQISQKCRGKKIPVLADKKLKLKIPGAHNIKNASMASVIALSLGVKESIIDKTVRNFKGLPHRLEFVCEIHGVKFYNDSASTNPAATIAAISAFDEPKILIMGGTSKGASFIPLKKVTKEKKVREVILFGANQVEIERAIKGSVKILKVKTLREAGELARKLSKTGDIIIFSPASASFDMFKNYEERGKAFKKMVNLIGS